MELSDQEVLSTLTPVSKVKGSVTLKKTTEQRQIRGYVAKEYYGWQTKQDTSHERSFDNDQMANLLAKSVKFV